MKKKLKVTRKYSNGSIKLNFYCPLHNGDFELNHAYLNINSDGTFSNIHCLRCRAEGKEWMGTEYLLRLFKKMEDY